MVANRSRVKRARGAARYRVSELTLRQMIEDATVDAHDQAEQAVGFLTLLEEHLRLPFEAIVLGVAVTVKRMDLTETNEIVAVCHRGKHRQAIPLLSLALPTPRPVGWEWIEAYRRWARGWRT